MLSPDVVAEGLSNDVSALDLLRLQSMSSPPRGLVLVVGSLGVLLGLADDLPDWKGCQKELLAQPVTPLVRRRSSGARHPGAKPPSLLQRLHSFDAAAVTAEQRQRVQAAQKDDVGGLMQPRHLEGVSHGAMALATWLQAAMQLIDSTPAPGPEEVSLLEAPGELQRINSLQHVERRESLFDAPKAGRCTACGKLMAAELLSEHAPVCRSRQLGKEVVRWEDEQRRSYERWAQAERSGAAERYRRDQSVRLPPVPPAAPPSRAHRAAALNPEEATFRPLPTAAPPSSPSSPAPVPLPAPALVPAEAKARPRPVPSGHAYLRAGSGAAHPGGLRSARGPPAANDGLKVLTREEHTQALLARLGALS